MLAVIQSEAIYLWYYFSIQFHQIVPYWIIGMMIGSLVSVFLKETHTPHDERAAR